MINMSATDKIKLSNTIVTVGKFDGLHKGHEKLLSELAKKANGRRKVVLTFAAEPKDVLNNQTVKTIVTDEEKRLLCEKQGIDVYKRIFEKKIRGYSDCVRTGFLFWK